VIGGAQLYAQLLPRADRLELTEVTGRRRRRRPLPRLRSAHFIEERRDATHADADNAFDFDFVELPPALSAPRHRPRAPHETNRAASAALSFHAPPIAHETQPFTQST
jgi:hypothetical protein